MSGVAESQQPPPGWLTSTVPAASDVATLDPNVEPSAWIRVNVYAVFGAYPVAETKSRAGNAISECGASGGSFATTTVTPADGAVDLLAAESTASTA